jgi:hypothetical protein
MSRKKISTTIYVTPEQSERLRLLHERTKVPVAVYIREGIDLVLRQYDHLLPGQLPLGGSRSESETPAPPSAVSGGASSAVAAVSSDAVGGGAVDRGRIGPDPNADRAAAASKG